MFTLLLLIVLINACNYNNSPINNDPMTNVPDTAQITINQAKLDSLTTIMTTHKDTFEKYYKFAQKTGNSEDHRIAYDLLKPYAQWKDSVNQETKALKTGMAKAENAHNLNLLKQKLKEEEQQRIESERKQLRNIAHYSGIIVIILVSFGCVLWLSRAKIKPIFAEYLLLLTFYMLFETLLVYTDSLIDTFIGGEPIYKLISNTLLAALVTISHEWSEKKMKAILFKVKRKRVRKRKII